MPTVVLSFPTPVTTNGMVHHARLLTARAAIVRKFHELTESSPSNEKAMRAAQELLAGIVANPPGRTILLRYNYLISYYDRSTRHQAEYFRERAHWLFTKVAEGARISSCAVRHYRMRRVDEARIIARLDPDPLSPNMPTPASSFSPGYSVDTEPEQPDRITELAKRLEAVVAAGFSPLSPLYIKS